MLRLAKHNGVTLNKVVEDLVLDADEQAHSAFERESPGWKAYFHI